MGNKFINPNLPVDPVPIVDHVKLLSCVERGGVIRKMTRLVRVTNIQNLDYTALSQALGSIGLISRFGDRLKYDTPGDPKFGKLVEGFEQLVCTDRNVAIVDEDPGTFDVTLEYEHIMDGPYQNLLSPPAGKIYGKIASSVQQKTTNFYRLRGGKPSPNGEKDAAGNPILFPADPRIRPITVGYTWPAKIPLNPLKNAPDVMGGEINVMFPHTTFTVEGYMDTDTPALYRDQMLTSINANDWMGKGPCEWMCTEFSYEMWKMHNQAFDIGRYRVSIQWQHNPDTWPPFVAFIDQRTNRPPPGLKMPTQTGDDGEIPNPELPPPQIPIGPPFFNNAPLLLGETPGWRYIRYYAEVNFDNIIGAAFENWDG